MLYKNYYLLLKCNSVKLWVFIFNFKYDTYDKLKSDSI